MKTIAFFNNKGGVGKTSLVYHLAWMYADRGLRVLVADLDPQANLTAMFIDDDRLIDLWEGKPGNTVVDSLKPLVERTGISGSLMSKWLVVRESGSFPAIWRCPALRICSPRTGQSACLAWLLPFGSCRHFTGSS